MTGRTQGHRPRSIAASAASAWLPLLATLLAAAVPAPASAAQLRAEDPVTGPTQERFDRMVVLLPAGEASASGDAAAGAPAGSVPSPSPGALSASAAKLAKPGPSPSAQPRRSRARRDPSLPADPGAPFGLAAREVVERGRRKVELSWRWPESGERPEKVEIERSTEGEEFEAVSSARGTLASDQLELSPTEFPWGLELYYRLRAEIDGKTVYSNAAAFTARPRELCAPTGLRMVMDASSTILQWQDGCRHRGSKYVIEAARGGGRFQAIRTEPEAGHPIVVGPSESPETMEESIAYRVKTVNSGVESPYSEPVALKPARIEPPRDLAIRKDEKTGRILLSWKAQDRSARGFVIEAATAVSPEWATAATVGPEATEHVVLDPKVSPPVDLLMFFRVRAVGRRGPGEPSLPISYNAKPPSKDERRYIRELHPSWTPRWAELSRYWTFDRPAPGVSSLGNETPMPSKVGNLTALALSPNGAGLSFVKGQVGDALSFDGIDDWIYAGSPGTDPFADQITVALWVKTAGVGVGPNQQTLVSMRINYGVQSVDLAINGQQLPFIWDPPTDTFFGNTSLGDAQWHHFAFTYDGNEERFYVDGRLDATKTRLGQNVHNGLAIGGEQVPGSGVPYGTPCYNLKGALDDVAMWKVALSAEEIALLYAHQTAPEKP